MTGYGRGEFTSNDIQVTAEARSLNNRFLDISVRLSKCVGQYEQKVHDLVRQYFSRGRINISITVKTTEDRYAGLTVDEGLTRAYLKLAEELKQKFSLPGTLSLDQIIALPDIITTESGQITDDAYWQCIESALRKALTDNVTMREKEGHQLGLDFAKRIEMLDSYIKKIEIIAKDCPQQEIEKLRERVSRISDIQQVDENRLEMELALLADRIDVTEECVRFHSHNKLFIDTVNEGETQGRRLNFLLQEMHREANTIGAKASNAEISHLVVLLKEEVERLREQIQNIE